MTSSIDPWIRAYRVTPMPRVRLACFAHAGASASFFRSWLAHLPIDVDLLALQYPGREDRFNEPIITSVTALAAHSGHALQAYADAPLVLFGHSLGAAVAYEVAHWLEARKAVDALQHLFVSGHPPPHLQRRSALHLASDDLLLADVLRQQGTDNHLLKDVELRSLFLPIIRSDYQAIETYQPESTRFLRCPVDVLAGHSDSEITDAEADGWQQASRTRINVTRFAGGHFYLIEERAKLIQHLLRKIEDTATNNVRA